MVFGPSGRVHDSQNQYYLFLETPEYSKEFNKKQSFLQEIIFRNLKSLELWKCRTKAGPKIPEDPFNMFFEDLECMIHIRKKT